MSAVARRYFHRGRAALDRGDLEAATENLRSSIDLAPDLASARLAYAVALARLGDCPRAARVLRAGLGRPASPRARGALWAALGDVLTQAGDFPAAEDAFRQAAESPALAGRAAAGLARVQAKTGRYRAAFASLRDAAQRSV